MKKKILKRYNSYIFLITFLLILESSFLPAQIKINEVMSSNGSTLMDEDGDYPDWIELYNSGDAALNLNGYSLTDDINAPRKWIFPEILIEPHKYLTIFASNKDRKDCIPYWNAVITAGDIWSYFIGNSEPPADWLSLAFNDQAWLEGPTGIGYGDNDDATEVPAGTMSIYLRKSFTLTDANIIKEASLHVDYDDGFIAYLNSTEIARANISIENPTYNQATDTYTEPKICNGQKPDGFPLGSALSLFRNGTNVLAIQLHNFGSTSSDLTIIPFLTLGFQSEPAAYRQPSDILEIIPVRLHTNFKISANGEQIALFNESGIYCDLVNLPMIPQDVSLGRYPDGAADWFYYAQPTPGTTNQDNGYSNPGSSISFSPPGGFYNSAVQVAISADFPTAKIYYTLDGALPNESSAIYTEPILINNSTTIRANCIQPGALAGSTATNTYIIGQQYDLPVISLAVNPPDLWDWNTGIYVLGPNASTETPNFGANFWQDWEKPVHVEFFEPNGNLGFALDAGLKIYGGWSRARPQKPLALFARSKYGSSEIDYQIFPDLPIDKFETLVLRISGNDREYTLFRDALMQQLVRGTQIDIQAYRPAVIYLNGEYWGIQNIREKINEHYIAAHFEVDPDNIDLLENRNGVICGDAQDYDALFAFIENNNLATSANYAYVTTKIDIENFIDYQVAEIYFDNTDWPGNNLKFWRERSASGRWRWIMFDTDFGFGLYNASGYQNNTLEFATATNGPDWPNPDWSTLFLRKLLENVTFRRKFINRFADFLNTRFLPSYVYAQIDSFQNLIAGEMPRHYARWKDSYYWGSLNGWYNQIEVLKSFARLRPAYMIEHLKSKFGLAGTIPLTIHITPAGGAVRINSVYTQQDSWQGQYFKGVPIELEAIPRPGFRFEQWTGSSSTTDNPITINPQTALNITACFVSDSSSDQEIVINEINYHSSPNFDPGEWIEILNNSPQLVNLSGWFFQDSNPNNRFTIPSGITLLPGTYLVLANDTAALHNLFPSVTDFTGEFHFNLNNDGESLYLFNPAGFLVDSLQYSNQYPWPATPDGNGPTLTLIDPHRDNANPFNWTASAGHGTPGTPNALSSLDPTNGDQATAFTLVASYPNPFNTSTTIKFHLNQSNRIKIEIFDLSGRLVTVLWNGRLTAGQHTLQWIPAGDLSSGLYFYRITGDDAVSAIRKIAYLK